MYTVYPLPMIPAQSKYIHEIECISWKHVKSERCRAALLRTKLPATKCTCLLQIDWNWEAVLHIVSWRILQVLPSITMSSAMSWLILRTTDKQIDSQLEGREVALRENTTFHVNHIPKYTNHRRWKCIFQLTFAILTAVKLWVNFVIENHVSCVPHLDLWCGQQNDLKSVYRKRFSWF